MKLRERWYSHRLQEDVTMVRWGTFGTPVLLFPTAGGDAEEVERFHMLDVLAPLVNAGRIKVYSADSVAGRVWLGGESSHRHNSWILNRFHEYIYHEVVPAIRHDCQTPDIEVIAAGASIGAFHAVAMVCRYPDAFKTAIGMSGTYNLEKFEEHEKNLDFYYASPHLFIPQLNGDSIEAVKKRFIVLASGQGRAEDIGESWRMAGTLGARGIPNRVDNWGPEWPHDWPTWRKMLPKYLEELA